VSVDPEPAKPVRPSNIATAQLAIFGAIYSTGASYFLQIAALGAGIVLARLVDPAAFGTMALAVTIYEFVSRIRLFGLNQILLSIRDSDESVLSTHFALTLGLSALTLGVTILLVPILGRFYPADTILILIVVAIISTLDEDGLSATPETLLRQTMRYKQLALIDVSAGLFSMVGAVTAAIAGWGVWALVVRQAVDTLTRFCGAWLLAGWRPVHRPTLERAKQFMRSGAHLWLGGVSSLVSFRYDDFLVGTLVGVPALGFYSRAFDYAKLPMGPLAGVYSVSLPTFARLKDDRQALSRAYNLFLDSIALFAIPASIWLALVVPEFVEGVIGPKWAPMIPLVRLLTLFAVLRPILDGTGGIPVVTGRPDIRFKQAILETVAMLGVGSLFIYWWGAIGAALASGIVVMATLIGLYFWYVKDSLDIAWRRTFLAPVVGVLAAAGVTYGFGFYIATWDALVRLGLKTGLFGIVFGIILLLFHRAVLLDLWVLVTTAWRHRSTEADPPTPGHTEHGTG
jgi:O-antigen/teichoic acid export membrane protein